MHAPHIRDNVPLSSHLPRGKCTSAAASKGDAAIHWYSASKGDAAIHWYYVYIFSAVVRQLVCQLSGKDSATRSSNPVSKVSMYSIT